MFNVGSTILDVDKRTNIQYLSSSHLSTLNFLDYCYIVEVMSMEVAAPQITEQIAEYIKKEILPAVPAKIEQFSSQNVEILRQKLHVLRYYCLQKGVNSNITGKLEAILDTSQILWEILADNANTFADLKETYRMRRLDLGAGLLGQIEEIISGEEDFRDIIINSIANFIGWKADTIWVDMAEKGRVSLSKSHVIRLKDELWQFIIESSQNGDGLTLEKAAEIGEKMDLLVKTIAGDDMPALARIMFITQIYSLLLRLSISRILIGITTDTGKI